MYEVMMDDDGFEEEIFGVSFDYEEEEFIMLEDDLEENFEDDLNEFDLVKDDFDNDQENFEGFVF